MVERLVILKHDELDNRGDKNGRMSKTQSFNTDDDDSVGAGELQQTEQDDPTMSISNENLLRVDEKRSLLSLNSPSIDSTNDPEGSISDIPLSDKLKKRKPRRTTEKTDSIDSRRSAFRKRPWYTRVDLTKPVFYLVLLFLIYLMWAERDVWIPRLLTSNSRVRLTALRNEEKLTEHKDLSSTKNSSSLSSNQDEIIDDNISININEQSASEDNEDDDDDYPTISNKQTSQKVNLRVRRNKMSFTRDRSAKKSRHSKHKIIDDDDEDVDEDDEDENNDDDDDTIQPTETVLPIPSISSPKKRHHQHKTKGSYTGKTSVIIRPYDDIIEQLRKLMKTHGKNRDLVTALMKETGLTKAKINRFIHQKDLSVVTLDTLISFLNSFDSTILIVSK